MRYITVLVVALLFASPLLAETPCDFKGVSVGSKMSPTQLMSALGVTKYKTNPPPHSQSLALTKKYGFIAAGEIEDSEIGPYCSTTMCTVPSGVAVGNNNNIPVKVDISFQEGVITKIVISFSETYWDEKLTIFDQKYGADWTIESNDMPITNYETKETFIVQKIVLQTKGTNLSTKDRCKIWTTNFDTVFEHHDALGPYHSRIVIQLMPKNF